MVDEEDDCRNPESEADCVVAEGRCVVGEYTRETRCHDVGEGWLWGGAPG